MPSLLQVLLNFSPKPCMYGLTMEMFLFVGPLLLSLLFLLVCSSAGLFLLLWLCFCRNCCCNLFRAQLGNWHSLSALVRCSSSLFRSSGVLDTTLALWAKVLYTLFLALMKWLPSQCVCWFPVNCCENGDVGSWCDFGIQKWYGAFCSRFFYCKLYVGVLQVDVV